MPKEPSISKPVEDYKTLNAELEKIVSELEADDQDIDAAMLRYERGLQLIQQLKEYLSSAENNVIEINAKFSKL